MTVGERLLEGSLRIDNGVTHHFGKKLLVSTACHGVESLLVALLEEPGVEVPFGASILFLREHSLPHAARKHMPCTWRCQGLPFARNGFPQPRVIHNLLHTVNNSLPSHPPTTIGASCPTSA